MKASDSQWLLDCEVDEEWCGADLNDEWPKREGWIRVISFSWWERNRRLYFVLDGNDYVLRYYTDETQKTLVGTVTLHPHHCDLHADVYNQLDLKTKNNIIRLRFVSIEEQQSWWATMLQTQVSSRKYKCRVDENEERPWNWSLCACGERSGKSSPKEIKEEVKFEEKKVVGKTPGGRPIITDNKGNTWTESKHLHTARGAYQEVLKALIRPKRAKYTAKDLGPAEFTFRGETYVRKDFTVKNPRKMVLQCSRWVLKSTLEEEEDISINDIFVAFHITDPKPVKQRPCVVYLHGNASCRIEALQILVFCLHLGLDLVTMDMSGSGLSEGEFVSLGYYEEDDVRVVCDYLRAKLGISQIALWGRSMGAVTAALYITTRDPTIECAILDSPFTSLTELCVELVKKQTSTVPSWVVRAALQMVKRSVKYRAHFNLSAINPLAKMSNCYTPILFVHGQRDLFIHMHHSEDLFKAAKGPKEIVLDPGTHSNIRAIPVFHAAQDMLTKHMGLMPREHLYRNPYATLPWKMGALNMHAKRSGGGTRGRRPSASSSELSDMFSTPMAESTPMTSPPLSPTSRANGEPSDASSAEFVAGMSAERQEEVEGAVRALGAALGVDVNDQEKGKGKGRASDVEDPLVAH
uniref:PH domain-containing protein n=1 Tax=Pyramimonas obovata TaxID=1411642 RepID=A0A7S0R1L5_9CHLO|mmetsp:Transcript_2344/g.4754  ORF Transcript_2344/g.4754 Transcript_2344/m.4754 type:complete len:636 (+) Transcript_2344:322-2229(+)|eukprot:CAMPEP_0118938432 /NCGR_PEP_ID=MMETSP1169-20130426/25861_1 /TAXON_ID=36882 /ORGANISM="Pyramimonas obovata, Strain CCMP722" /LENGTH=635 /DNA_ID=CAMNT_0006882355 /DNA_START=232 /DNA_END=2139 /DNA_ORIENTATION=-